MDAKELEFSVFCIESLAERLDMPGEAVYLLLSDDSDVLDDYIVKSYDVLHTQDKEYIIDDILECMRERGLCP